MTDRVETMPERQHKGRIALAVLLLVAHAALAGEAVVVPVVGHTGGAQGSQWRTDVRLINHAPLPASGWLSFTPLGQSSGALDVRVPVRIPAWSAVTMSDVYRAGYPTRDGLARLQIVMDENEFGLADPLVVEAVTYNELAGGGTLGQIIPALRPRDFWPRDTTLGAVSGAGHERTNIVIITGPERQTLVSLEYWTTAGRTSAYLDLGPDTTVMRSLQDLFGQDVPADMPLRALIITGSARLGLTKIDNRSNQPRWVDVLPVPGAPRITGLDHGCSGHSDGVPDLIDEDNTGTLRPVIGIGCNAPYPAQWWILVDPPATTERPYTYFAEHLPQGMSLEPGTGIIHFDPPCTISGDYYTVSFWANSNAGSTQHVLVTFFVNP